LDDVNAVDEDGKAVLDEKGEQVVTLGLKSQWIATIKEQAAGLLAPTDWYVTRKAEDSTATIPSNVTTYRAAVRTKSGTIEKAITDAADHAAFMALFDAPVDSDGNPTGNAPINDWPDEL
jgi:acetylornithine/succinyldiaminopimelate/putrescine aminotransferase